MLDISYQISSYLLDSLKKIEDKRSEILLFPLSPKRELQLQFSKTLERIQTGLFSSYNLKLSKTEIIKILSSPKAKNLTKEEGRVIEYKKYFDFLRQYWLVNPKPIDAKTILLIHS